MARSEDWSCPLRLPTPAAAHVAIASGVRQRVTSPRRTRTRSYSAQFPTRDVVLHFGCTLDFTSRSWTRRRSRWATCRPLLAHRAESTHQRPQILALTVDRDEDFVRKPRISESTLTSLQPPGVIGAELPAPLPNSFVRHDDAAFGQQILDIPEAQAVSVIQPDGVADDVRRKAMPKVAGSSNVHPGIVPRGELT